MTNIEERNTRVQVMASCWAVATDLGFSPRRDVRGPVPGGYAHRSSLLYLVELDEETTWEVLLFESYTRALGGTCHRETGRVRVTRVSVDQFRVILSGLVSQVEG
jgi:hypothetical protein